MWVSTPCCGWLFKINRSTSRSMVLFVLFAYPCVVRSTITVNLKNCFTMMDWFFGAEEKDSSFLPTPAYPDHAKSRMPMRSDESTGSKCVCDFFLTVLISWIDVIAHVHVCVRSCAYFTGAHNHVPGTWTAPSLWICSTFLQK